jgi:hypothetical protein
MSVDINRDHRLPRKLLAARTLLVALALVGIYVGGWAETAPAAFYRHFPGFGRHWLPPLGPYNEHLVRDFGALNLGLAAAAIVAAVTLTRSATATAVAAWLVYSVPHLAFHATHGGGFAVEDDIAVLVMLASAVIAAAVALWLVATTPALHQPVGPVVTRPTRPGATA